MSVVAFISFTRTRAIAGLGLAALGLAACSTPGADAVIAQPEAVQQQAYADCVRASSGLGVSTVQLNRLAFDDGRVLLSAVNGNGLSLSQARSLNQCARARLLSGQVSAASTTYRATSPQASAHAIQLRSTSGVRPAPGCVPGLGAMQRGIYCVGH